MPAERRLPALRVTMLLYGEVERDARVRREAATLVDCGYRVTIATLTRRRERPFELDGARIVPLRPPRAALLPGDESPFRSAAPASPAGRAAAAGRWLAGYGGTFALWTRAALRRLPPADVWHGHDLLGLLAAAQLRRRHGGALVHDSHELFLEAGSAARLPGPARRLLGLLEGRASRSADAVITVNESIAAELARRYGVHPIVVMNCPPLAPPPQRLVLRERLGLAGRPVVVHHGVIGPGRGLDVLARSLAQLPSEAAVVLLGSGPLAAHFAVLADQPEQRGRLFVVPAVPLAEVRSWIADADVGVIPFQPVDRNNVLGTPNKLFEYLDAGVPMVVSDFPEMRRVVDETGAGIAADATRPETLAAAIQALLDEPPERREVRRERARRAAEERYNWGVQSRALVAAYERMAAQRAEARGAGFSQP